MHKNKMIALYRIIFAGVTLAAVVAQLITSSKRVNFNPVHFFSFFTIESNIFAALVFIVAGVLIWQDKRPAWLDMVRGAAVVYMVTTGLVYMALLSGLEDTLQTTTPWVNVVVHQLFPVVVALDWFIDRSRRYISLRNALLWLLFPLTYAIYTLLRGPIVEWYPYPFINPIMHGYVHVAVMCAIVAVVIYILCVVVARVSPRPIPGRATKKRT